MDFDLEEIVPHKNVPTGCVIFFHGTGSSGLKVKEDFVEMVGEHPIYSQIKFIFPTAKTIFCSYFEKRLPCWLNLSKDELLLTKISSDELKLCQNYVERLVRNVVDSGIPASRIIIAGISLGALLALLSGYVFAQDVKGIASLSGFYPISFWSRTINGKYGTPESLHLHFTNDPTSVTLAVAKIGTEFLSKKSISCELKTISGNRHHFNKEMLIIFLDWVNKKLTDI